MAAATAVTAGTQVRNMAAAGVATVHKETAAKVMAALAVLLLVVAVTVALAATESASSPILNKELK